MTHARRDVIDYASPLADKRNVYLDLRPAAAPVSFPGDRGALFVLLKNLVENAIQHSPVGGVVALLINERDIRIRDEGSGIRPEDLPKLFARFWRSSERRDEGAGLGLAICKEIADAHDWRIAARNLEHGAEFALVFASR